MRRGVNHSGLGDILAGWSSLVCCVPVSPRVYVFPYISFSGTDEIYCISEFLLICMHKLIAVE